MQHLANSLKTDTFSNIYCVFYTNNTLIENCQMVFQVWQMYNVEIFDSLSFTLFYNLHRKNRIYIILPSKQICLNLAIKKEVTKEVKLL